MEQAFFAGDAHRPELIRALDRDGDGRLGGSELVLDTEAKVHLARDLLVGVGVRAPEIAAEVKAHAIHHGISPGRFATRDCEACHAAGSRIGEPFGLASVLPFGVVPAFVGGGAAGPARARAAAAWCSCPTPAGLHVFGHTRNGWLDGLGLVLFVGAFAGAGAHAILRIRSARRRRQEPS